MSEQSSYQPVYWTDEKIREAFIYDGGEAAYRDPINGDREQRRIAGGIFDSWLAEHDAAIRASIQQHDSLIGDDVFATGFTTGHARFGGIGGDIAHLTITREAWNTLGDAEHLRVIVTPVDETDQ